MQSIAIPIWLVSLVCAQFHILQLSDMASCSGITVNTASCFCRKAGFHPALTDTRGFDHGTFVPLKLAFPAATIPVLQLSLLASMDAKVQHVLLCFHLWEVHHCPSNNFTRLA